MDTLSSLFAILVSLVVPLGAALWLAGKRQGYLKPILLGAATFLVFQVATRLPLLSLVLPKMMWFSLMTITQPFLTALFYSATAALFEEGGRWIVMRLFMKNNRRAADGIAFGVGHGGIEAILLVGVNTLAALIMSISAGTPGLIFASGVERVSAMAMHIAWSVMVLKSISKNRPLLLLAAFLLHTFVNTVAVMAQELGASLFMIEALLGVFALFMLGYVVFEYKTSKGGQVQ